MLVRSFLDPLWSSLPSEYGVGEVSIGVSSNLFAISQQLQQVLHFFSKKFRHIRLRFPVNTSHFRTVDPGVHHEVVGNKRSLRLVDLLALLLLVELEGLGFVVVS